MEGRGISPASPKIHHRSQCLPFSGRATAYLQACKTQRKGAQRTPVPAVLLESPPPNSTAVGAGAVCPSSFRTRGRILIWWKSAGGQWKYCGFYTSWGSGPQIQCSLRQLRILPGFSVYRERRGINLTLCGLHKALEFPASKDNRQRPVGAWLQRLCCWG